MPFSKERRLEKLLLFIGSPRTGSSLIGQILNYHPECLVAHESRLVTNVVMNDIPYQTALKNAEDKAFGQFNTGLENDDYFGKNLDRYQKKWIPMNDLIGDADFKKKDIRIIGDKKAGGFTQASIDQPEKTRKFLEDHPEAVLLQIIRNPIDAAVSYMRSHRITPFQKACSEIVIKTHVAYVFGKKATNPFLCIYYEKLLNSPEIELKKILTWLGVGIEDDWLRKISTKINKATPKKHLEEYRRLAKDIIRQYEANEEFSVYRILK
ncbi:sulfotransferase [Desulfosarcina ovata]